MTYGLIAAGGLLIALVCGSCLLVAAVRRSPRLSSRRVWGSIGLSAIVLLILTAVFDNLMIAAGLFTYAPDLTLGIQLGAVPLEDFSYPLAAVLVLPGLWLLLSRDTAQRRKDFAQLVLASRPISWINTAFPFGAAYLLIHREIDWVFLVGIIYFLVPYNFAMYGINDVFDYESDLANPRKGGIEGALLAPRLHRPTLWIAAASNLPFLLLLASAGGPASWLALAVSAFALVAYSAPGLRWKERPFLDSLTSSTHFVSPAVVGVLLAGGSLEGPLLVVLMAFFLWGMAAHAFGAVQDIGPDRAAAIGSIATVFGAKATVRTALVLWVLAGVMMLGTPWPGPLAAVVAIPYLLNCAPYWSITDADAASTNRAWRRFIALNFFSGFLVTLIMIIEWNYG